MDQDSLILHLRIAFLDLSTMSLVTILEGIHSGRDGSEVREERSRGSEAKPLTNVEELKELIRYGTEVNVEDRLERIIENNSW